MGFPYIPEAAFRFFAKVLKRIKVHPESMLISDERSGKIGKNALDCFSISLLVSRRPSS